MILKITLMPQTKEAFVWTNINTKSTLQYPFQFCSDVSFIHKIFSRNWHLLFVFTLLISNLTFMFLLLSLLVSVQLDISKIFFVSWVKIAIHTKMCTKYQICLENKLNNFWTWNNSILMKYHTGDSAVWIIIIWVQFGCQVFGTARLTVKRVFPETVFSSDHNNNLKWAILGT